MKNFLVFLLIQFCSFSYAKTWWVGPSHSYNRPSQVSSLVADGDSVWIEAGLYEKDVCLWKANHLFISGYGGYAVLDAKQTGYGGKAIWVIAGDNSYVAFIEFSHCEVVDKNGAGIRQEGKNLRVNHCRFISNQNGILAGDYAGSEIIVEHCEFDHNGSGTGYTHNIYVNHIQKLVMRYNYIHHAYYGHEIKSRAHENVILYNRITNEDGDASYEIDLPNGGQALVLGNIIQQSKFSDNNTIISFGREGLTNTAPHIFYFINNTVVNQEDKGILFNIQSKTDTVVAINNLIAGNLTLISGIPVSFIESNNIKFEDLNLFNFKNPAHYDYHLTESSPGIDGGLILNKAVLGYELRADKEYVHPIEWNLRYNDLKVDLGAHEKQQITDTRQFDVDISYPYGFQRETNIFKIFGPHESLFDGAIMYLIGVEGKHYGRLVYSLGYGIQLPITVPGMYYLISDLAGQQVVWPLVR